MKNVLKNATLSIFLVLSSLCFTSCEDNDDDYNVTDLYGHWDLTSVYEWYVNGEGEYEGTRDPEEGEMTILIFKSDGYMFQYIKNSGYESGYDKLEFYYELSGNEIYYCLEKGDNLNYLATIKELDRDKLVLCQSSALNLGGSVISESYTEMTYRRAY